MNIDTLLAMTPSEWANLNPLQAVNYPPIDLCGIELYLKREELLHETLSGNKLYKLYGHLQAAVAQSCKTLISFGGYHSNHLHALATLGQSAGFKTVGYIRGHEPETLTATMIDCADLGMELRFLSRIDYKRKSEAEWLKQLQCEHEAAYLIPEGGQGKAGMEGCRAILTAIRNQIGTEKVTVCLPCGTGTTLAGLLYGSRPGDTLLGFSALKLGPQAQDYKSDIERQVGLDLIPAEWNVIGDYHCGGFARRTPELIDFINDFETVTNIALDPVYTGKMLYGIEKMAQSGYWPEDHKVVAIHTGGLQGRRGVKELAD